MKVPNLIAAMLSILMGIIWVDTSRAEPAPEPIIVSTSKMHLIFKIKTQPNSEQFQIVLQNCGTRTIKCQDFRHGSTTSRAVP